MKVFEGSFGLWERINLKEDRVEGVHGPWAVHSMKIMTYKNPKFALSHKRDKWMRGFVGEDFYHYIGYQIVHC